MNTSAANERFGDLDGTLRLAIEQIASAPPPVKIAEWVLARAAKWNEATVRTPVKTKTGLYLTAVAALALVVLVAVTIAIVAGTPERKSIVLPPPVKQTEPPENPTSAAAGASPALGMAPKDGSTSPAAGASPDMRLGAQPRGGFGGSGGFGAGGGVPSKRGGVSVAQEDASKIDQERMVGTWAIVNEESKRTAEMWAISEDRILMYANYSGMTAIWHFHRLDAGEDPKQIDITVTKVNGSPSSPLGIIKGIYALDGDELRLCLAEMGKDRPTKFPEKPGPGEMLILHRGKLGASPPKGNEAPQKDAEQKPSVKEKPAEAAVPPAKPAAPQKNPLLGVEAAEHVKKFPPSFSKAQEGLEIGIAIASERKAFHFGERVPLEFVIRNASQKTLVVQHSLYPPETPPTVRGADDKQLSIEEILLLGANRRYKDTLKPGEVAVYQHMGLGLGEEPNPPGTFWYPFLKDADAAPGKYRLSQPVRVTVREEGKDGGTALNTASGEVAFEIGLADPKKDADKPADKPAKPAATTVTFQGKVVDDVTGEKIDRFFTQGGKFDPADPTKVTWGTWELRTRGRSDWFQTEIRWGEGMTARIVADGYLPEPVLTSAPEGDKKIIETTLRLKRGRKVRGVVLDHAGKPLQDAAVIAIGPTVVTMAAGEVLTSGSAKSARTDEQGRFELPAGEAKSLAVSHKQFDAWPAIIPASGEVTVRLPEPARIEINLDIDGADKESNIYYELIVSQMPEFRERVQGGVLRCETYAKIANPGKLVLAGLPPGKYQLSRRPGRMLENQMFEIKSGEVKTIDYVRKTGARVRGKVTLPAGAMPSGITVTVTGEPVQKSPWSDHQWATVYAALTPAKDGTFLTERIPPGAYELAAYAYEPVTKGGPSLSGFGGLSGPTLYAAVTITVPAEGEVKAGDLELKSSRAGK